MGVRGVIEVSNVNLANRKVLEPEPANGKSSPRTTLCLTNTLYNFLFFPVFELTLAHSLSHFFLFISSDRDVFIWGDNSLSQLGNAGIHFFLLLPACSSLLLASSSLCMVKLGFIDAN